MTSVYNLLREACDISQSEAADHVHETRLDTVKSWCSGRRQAPQWAINQLQSLSRRIRRSGEAYARRLREELQVYPSLTIGLPADDADARANGFPSTAAQMRAIAIAISLLPDDADIRLQARAQFPSTGVPTLEPDQTIPTATDRQILSEMAFRDGRFYSAGIVNRRKYERLVDIGWIKGHSPNLSDVEYHLTLAGRIELKLLAAAAEKANDLPDPAPGGFQTRVNPGPRRSAIITLKIGEHLPFERTSVLVTAIDGDVITAKTSSGIVVTLSAPAILLPHGLVG